MKNYYSRFKTIVLLSIILFLFALAISARGNNSSPEFSIPVQQQEVRGVVTDQNGLPLSGVTVRIKNSNRGTVTDLNGQFHLEVGFGNTLIISYLGYKKLEVQVDGRRELDIQLTEDITSLNAVEINTGYYSTTRRESTGNISRVTAEEIEQQPVISPLQALQGRMAGVEILPNGNQPGMASTIRIRGRNSLREDGNFPLYIIDGVPINSTPVNSNSLLGNPGPGVDPLNSLNLSNIESIEVLKDADATAIYGSRGANGVVLITTRRGRPGKTGLEAQVYTGASTVPNRLDLLNTQQYLELRRRAFENDGVEPTAENAFDLVLWDQDRYTDWQDFFFGGTSNVTNANVTSSGGNEKTYFRLGGSYHKQGSVYRGDLDYRKVTANLNLNHTSEDNKLSLDLAVNYGVDSNNLVGNVDLSSSAFYLPPNAPSVFSEDGGLNWEDWEEVGWGNPLEGLYNTSNTQANTLISGLGISYALLKGLSVRTSVGYNYSNSRELMKRPLRSYSPSGWPDSDHASSHLETYRNSWIVEPQLIYDTRIGKGNLDALLGGTFQESEYDRLGFQGEGYVSEDLIGNLDSAERIVNATSHNTDYRYNAIFGRLGYNWDEKYFLNLTGRRDGSSRFGSGNQLANFWAMGGAWIFSEESLFNGNSFLSFGKFRVSYGTTGNDQIGDYGYLDSYEATPGPGGLYPTQLANPDYSWEENKKLEGAVELGFFKDRVNLGISWYRNRSSSQLVGYALPSITGFTSVQTNLPATVENTGVEVEVSTMNFQTDNFRWQTFFNISFPKNELIEYPDIEQSSYANMYKVGHPLNISMLYQYAGIDPETGFYSIEDINEDGRFDYEDRVVIQDRGREFFGGMNNSISYKNISLQFLWEFVKQEGTLNLFETGAMGNQRVDVMQALEGSSHFQQVSQSPQASIAYSRVLNTTLPVVDASFLRLKTISLGYSLPSSLLRSMGLRNGKIFLNGQNLYTLTSYEGLDPEMPYGGKSFGGYRTITGGLQLQF